MARAAWTSATSATAALRAAALRAEPLARLGRETCHFGVERRDVAQEPRGGGLGRLIAGSGPRIVANAAMEGGQPGSHLREAVRRRQHVVHQSDSGDADRDRSAARHARFEHMLGRVDLLNRDERNGVAGKHRGVGAVSVRQSGCIDAEPHPSDEGGEQQIPGLGEDAGDRDGRRDADPCRHQPVGGLVQSFAARRRRQDRPRQGRGRRRFQFEPET